MSCRITRLTPDRCEYVPPGVGSIELIDFEDFVALKFTDDLNYDANYVVGIIRNGNTVGVETTNVAKYEMSRAGELYVHTISAFLTGLSADLASSLDLARQRRYVVIFTTKTGRSFIFGSDVGATVSYGNQTEGATGSALTITARSRYPLFEADPQGLRYPLFNYTWLPDFVNGAVCEWDEDAAFYTGNLQAITVYKIGDNGQPMDINNVPISMSGRLQAIMILEDTYNPDPSRYEVQGTFKWGDPVEGVQTMKVDAATCPIGYIIIHPDFLIFNTPDPQSIEVESTHSWRVVNAPPSSAIQLDTLQGPAGYTVVTITVTPSEFGSYSVGFQNMTSGEIVTLPITIETTGTWILSNGFWWDDGEWEDTAEWIDGV